MQPPECETTGQHLMGCDGRICIYCDCTHDEIQARIRTTYEKMKTQRDNKSVAYSSLEPSDTFSLVDDFADDNNERTIVYSKINEDSYVDIETGLILCVGMDNDPTFDGDVTPSYHVLLVEKRWRSWDVDIEFEDVAIIECAGNEGEYKTFTAAKAKAVEYVREQLAAYQRTLDRIEKITEKFVHETSY